MPTKAQIAHKAMKAAGQKMGALIREKLADDETAVNAAGFVGSQVGASVAGPIGAVVGDVTGAVATRKALTDYKAFKSAKAKLEHDEAFQAAGKLEKLKKLGAATLSELKTMQKEIEDNRTGDVGGWAIGNGSAAALEAAGSAIPLQGAAVAIAATPTVVKAHRRIREGEKAGTVIKETAQEIATAPIKAVKSGEDREQKARRSVSNAIRDYKIKAGVAVTSTVASAGVKEVAKAQERKRNSEDRK